MKPSPHPHPAPLGFTCLQLQHLPEATAHVVPRLSLAEVLLQAPGSSELGPCFGAALHCGQGKLGLMTRAPCLAPGAPPAPQYLRRAGKAALAKHSPRLQVQALAAEILIDQESEVQQGPSWSNTRNGL